MKNTIYLENLNPFISVVPKELDDTIDCFLDDNFPSPEENIAHFATQKEILTAKEADDD